MLVLPKLLHCSQHAKNQLNSYSHSADFRVSWTKWPCPILITFTQKSFKLLLAFLNLHQHAKNQFLPSTHSWDTVNFRVLWSDWPHPFLTTPTPLPPPQFFWLTFNSCEFVSTCKKSGYITDLFWRYGWLKNPTIWLADNILTYISETKIFPNT